MVHDRLMARTAADRRNSGAGGRLVLPDTYDFERGESRAAVLDRMQAAMAKDSPSCGPNGAADSVAHTRRKR